ncbi:hypothetical protein [Aquimarina agarivorans]|uniref:hypothetical protein n=1 Tax=Aquimarina agarivorans TaxID=980584 RepID=UPI000248FCAF|nr:hypothetical protein [Aquimarina agarivorans]
MLFTNGYLITSELENFDYEKRLSLCLSEDNKVIDLCDEILNDEKLPIEIQENILNINWNLMLNSIEISKIKKLIESKSDPASTTDKLVYLHSAR